MTALLALGLDCFVRECVACCSASVSFRKAETISLIQVQTVFQNTTGKNVGNCTEDGVFCAEKTKESEEISGVSHECVEVVKSDAQKHNDKERKIDHLIDSIDDGIAENRTDDFVFADNCPRQMAR